MANADLPYVYQRSAARPGPGQVRSLAHKRYSCSVISFFWGVDRPYQSWARTRCSWPTTTGRTSTASSTTWPCRRIPACTSTRPARLDPAMAPAGQDTLIAIVPVGHLDEQNKQDWLALRDQGPPRRVPPPGQPGIHDLEGHHQVRSELHPAVLAQALQPGERLHPRTVAQPDPARLPAAANRHPHYHNLYFAGASTHPGTGLPTALVSARLAAARIVEELGMAGGT